MQGPDLTQCKHMSRVYSLSEPSVPRKPGEERQAQHVPQSISPALAQRWTDLLIDSDRRYFAAGATMHRVPGGRLALMPGLTSLSAGAVVLIGETREIVLDPLAWRDAAVAVCAARGVRQLRFYTSATDATLSSALASAEIPSFFEIAMAGYAAHLDQGSDAGEVHWSLREITTPALWRTKQRLHDQTPERPDNKAADAKSWVRLERAKTVAGYMSPYLIERNGEACGAFGLSFTPGMLRFKNFFITPEHRGRGAATAAVRLVAREALMRGIESVGCWVLAGSHSGRLYERAGFTKVGRQMEWLTPVGANTTFNGTRPRNAIS